MGLTKLLDAVFVNQLFSANQRGETIFSPNGPWATAYIVPPEREGAVRSGLRWLFFFSVAGTMTAVWLLPRLLESWGITISLPWLIALVAITLVVGFILIMRRLSRLTVGLEPVPAPSRT